MLSIGTVVIGVEDLHRAVAFWTHALNYVPKREIAVDDDFAILVRQRATVHTWRST